jgi:hypothetical protein
MEPVYCNQRSQVLELHMDDYRVNQALRHCRDTARRILRALSLFQRYVSSPTAYLSELDVRIMLVILRRFRL